jgi:PAS domain S-box-containing protein
MASQSNSQLSKLRTKHHATLGELERYKLLVESVQDYAIFFMDKDGTILTWNKGAEKAKGYKPHEIIGKNFSVFYDQHDNDVKKPQRELELAQLHGRVEDEDWRVRKDGSKFWANVVITALYDDDHELVGFAKVTRDLTERKHQEDAVRSANSLLKLQQAELKKLNASKDEFISLASHQLRTPATAVKQLLGMLIEGLYGQVAEDILPILVKAYDSNERQINIVNNLLKVAQLDAGKVTLDLQPMRLDKLLRDVVDEQRDTLQRRRQTLVVHLPDYAVPGMHDMINMRMALSNIVDNATKYSPEDSTISVDFSQSATQSTIHVHDQGVGIRPEDQTKLFDKFTRIQNKLSDQAGGSGLGLYWSKKIIELHGGNISVDSAIGKGTTFTICLPCKGKANA